MEIAVIGSRDYKNTEEMFRILDEHSSKIEGIVSGGAQGADTLAQDWAKQRGKKCTVFYANWRPGGVFDKGAGFRRNRKIIEFCDGVYAYGS